MDSSGVMDTIAAQVMVWLDKFVQWNVDHEWIGSKSLFLVTPGQGLDAIAIDLADTIGFDLATMKVSLGYMITDFRLMHLLKFPQSNQM